MNTARPLTGLGRRRRRRWTRDQIQVTDPEVMRRSIRGGSIGNFMEWYDFGVYGYIATTIAQVFYPGDSVSAVHLIATFSTLAAAFVVRPVGGDLMVPAYMLIVAGLVGAVTLFFTPEVAGRRLPGSPPTVETDREARTLAADVE